MRDLMGGNNNLQQAERILYAAAKNIQKSYYSEFEEEKGNRYTLFWDTVIVKLIREN